LAIPTRNIEFAVPSSRFNSAIKIKNPAGG
jgi:hypothetical protein